MARVRGDHLDFLQLLGHPFFDGGLKVLVFDLIKWRKMVGESDFR